MTALVAGRAIGYLALAVFAGGLVFVSLLWPAGAADRRTRLILTTAVGTGIASALAGIGLQGAYAGALPATAALRPGVLRQSLDTHLGQVWAARALLWVLAAVVLAAVLQRGEAAVGSLGWRIGAVAVGFGLLRTTGMASHAADAAHAGWSAVADLVHLAGMSAWVGGLVVLLAAVLPRRQPAELAAVVPRYSRLELTSVSAIVAAGSFLAWQLVGSLGGLLHTSYGRTLLVKLAVFALVLGAAQRRNAWVTRRLPVVVAGGRAATVRPFVYSVAAETTLVLVVLSAASVLVTASPGR
jgi:copper transport protein